MSGSADSRTGRIEHLYVEPTYHGLGYGPAAALAAEDLLRSRDCHQVLLAAPAEDERAQAQAEALGYTAHHQAMLKRLVERAELPQGSRVREMTDAEFSPWWAATREWHARDEAAAGGSLFRARADMERAGKALLGRGPATPGTALPVLAHHGADIGTLWTGLVPEQEADAWAYFIHVDAGARRQGHGRTLMLATEQTCWDAGARSIGLYVKANTPSLTLCTSLGYRVLRRRFSKRL